MKDHQAIIFDWGGVLMRTEDHTFRLTWDQKLGLAPGTVESIVHGIEAWQQAQCGTLTVEAYWQQVGSQLGLSTSDLDQLRLDFYRGDQLDMNLINFIKELRKDGVTVGLLSNNSLELVDDLSRLKIRPLFDSVVVSAQVGVMKPDERAYQIMLRELDTDASDSLFVDDSLQNIEGARQTGMAAIHFTPALDLRNRISEWLEGQD